MVQRRKGAAKDAAARYGDPPSDINQQRMRTALGFLIACFVLVLLRLVQLNLSPGHRLTEEELKHIGSVQLQESRGEIYDREGLILATTRKSPSLWVDPRYVQEPEALAHFVSTRLGLDRAEVHARLTQRDKNGKPLKFAWIKRWVTDVPLDVLEEIEEYSSGAVSIRYENVRYYPQEDTAAHLLGFVNRDGAAAEGVELTYDKYLRSEPGKYVARKDSQRRMLGSLTLAYEEPSGGDNLYLTIDTAIQHSLERALDARKDETGAKRSMGIVMDPHTGAILALACRPAFDPNIYDKFDPELRKNRAIADVYEPGSVFKIVTASAVLEHEIITPRTLIDCENGGFNPYGHYIKDFHKLGVEPFQRCFAESSNVAIIKLAAKLGPERLDQWIQRFGFAKSTSRDFRGESRGIYVPHGRGWSRLSMGSLPMGQEIAVTMLQMARSFAVIANGGYLVEPHFVDRAVARDGSITYQYEPPAPERILSPSTADIMQELCGTVVTEGTGSRAQILEYRVGGKTGTAQMARSKEEGGGYDPNRYTTVFAGFAPVADPKLVAVIVVQEPTIKLRYGGYVCGPVFKEVVREGLIRLNVPQDPVLDEDGIPLIAKEEAKRKEAEARAEAKRAKSQPANVDTGQDPDSMQVKGEQAFKEPDGNLQLVANAAAARAAYRERRLQELKERGTAPATAEHHASPASAAPLPIEPTAEPEIQRQASREGTLPDFRGMTKREVQTSLQALGIPWDTQGAGWVVHQSPAPGTALALVDLCALQFASKTAMNGNHEPKSAL